MKEFSRGLYEALKKVKRRIRGEYNNEIIIFLIYRPSKICEGHYLLNHLVKNVTRKRAIIFKINSLQDNKKKVLVVLIGLFENLSEIL